MASGGWGDSMGVFWFGSLLIFIGCFGSRGFGVMF